MTYHTKAGCLACILGKGGHEDCGTDRQSSYEACNVVITAESYRSATILRDRQ